MKVFIGNSPTEAHIVQQQLENEGILCEVRGEGVYTLRGEVPFDENTLPYVWLIDNKQHVKARAIIAEWQEQLKADSEKRDWVCPRCHEVNEAQFGACWSCQALAPTEVSPT